MKLKNKKVLVYGLGTSGHQTINFLLKKKAKVFVFDDYSKEQVPNTIAFNINYDFKQIDFAIVSPGIYDTYLLKLLSIANIPLYSEIEFASFFVKKGKIIAITGTNGKTTTTQIIGLLLRESGAECLVCGNIGVPFISCVEQDKKNMVFVVEVSSFQLEHCNKFRPHVAIITNITPDHLNRHKTMQVYTDLKFAIAKNQTGKDLLIVNQNLLGFEHMQKIKAKVQTFGQECSTIFEKDGLVWLEGKKFLSTQGFAITGQKNMQNLMAAILAVLPFGVGAQQIENVAKTFKTDKHRIERVAKIGGVTFVDDSKATNVESTICALEALANHSILLLLGGSDKGYEFEQIFDHAHFVKHVFCYGQTKNKIALAAQKKHFKNITVCDNMMQATMLAIEMSQKGDTVLLSPACASFDEFTSYEHRAQVFRRLIYAKNKT